jgi:class 3 adenylate cyclase/tetratricopeptide (TPR) repeat protein
MTDLRRHVPPIALAWDIEAPGESWRCVDGTLVFADISGFTALTEKLSGRGRIGAEEIVETLNRVFGPMLRIAASRGGELLKFGGDALLFLFRGDGHPEQACDAAVEMRAALRQAAAVPTSVGRLSLSMSVGVHAGDIHLFLVGAPTRELLVLGPGATATAQAEKSAEAGQIVVSPATAARLRPQSVRPRKDGELLLRRRNAHSEAPGWSGVPPAAPDLLRSLFPHVLGEYLAPAVPDPEHRMACIAFIRFTGTDALLAGPGPAVLAEALHRTVSLVEESLVPEGVTLLATDLDSDGGKFFLGSGLPTSHEDNEGRMLRALRRIADSDSPLPLQVGVNRGHVFAAEVGIPERGAYTGMGDTTNTAARITAKAPGGTIYAHPAVLEHSRTRFDVTPAGPFAMKGKAVPLLVYEVGEELGTREEATSQARLPFLGRDEEVAAVRGAVERALSGAGGVVTVQGGTGMGKSRLLQEALGDLAITHTVVIRAEPYGAASAYRVFRDPARRLLGIERDEPAVMGRALLASLERVAPELLPMAPLLADLLQVEVPGTPEADQIDPQYRPHRLADAVVTLMERTLPGRLVMVAEEAHWADAASARLLERIGAAADGRPWAVVAVRRSVAGGFTPSVGARVTLEPLPPEVVERLVIAATQATPLRPHEIAVVVDRAEGSPLYVEEVTRVALDAGSMEALPESVQEAMSAQIDMLPPDSRRILRYCSVLGRSFRIEVLRRALAADGMEAGHPDLGTLGTFLQSDGADRWRFRNSLVRDAAYEGLAFRTRVRLHRQAGEVVEGMSTNLDADAATLSLHFFRAGDHRRTWRYAQRAGAVASRTYANADAAVQFQRAIDAAQRVPGVGDGERAQLWQALGEVQELAGVLDGSIESYRRAAGLTPDPLARTRILIRLARVQERAGSYRAALHAVARARRLLTSSSEAEAAAATRCNAQLDTMLALIRLGQEKPGEARKWAAKAVSGARGAEDPETLVQALMAIDYADALLGRPVDGAHTREALDLCVAHGFRPRESVARANLGGYAFYAGRWSEAVEWFASSREAAVAAGNAFGAAETDLSLSEILIHQGRAREAEPLLVDAVRVLGVSGMDFARAYGEMLLANVFCDVGELDRAYLLASRVADEFASMGHYVSALEASLVLARVATQEGRPAEALLILEAAEAATKGDSVALLPRTSLARALALQALGRSDEAAAEVATGLNAARDMALPYEEALLLLARADISATADALAEAERARGVLIDLGARTD